jgi:light-regulated signal transduction histidine kinase (bacteriophytochrome)
LQEPLRKIQAFSERLKVRNAEQLSSDGMTNLLKINQSAARMQQLINDLLIFSRTANLRERIFEDINLNETLEEVKEEFQEMIEEKRATIISDVLPNINGIRFQMVQLFSNLISNAIKYAKADEDAVIEIECQKVSGEELQIEGVRDLQRQNIFYQISFKDNGIGFDSIYSEKIFVIFQRLHNRTEYDGTGIGLALCRRIVTNHNGFIVAESRPRHAGAVFYVYLPKQQFTVYNRPFAVRHSFTNLRIAAANRSQFAHYE